MIYHIVVGDMAATPLQEAINAEPSMEGRIIVMKDLLHVGPLQKAEKQSFSDMRTAFWKEVINDERHEIAVDDLERLLEAGNNLSAYPEHKVWFWMAPWPADVCTYYWMLGYLGKYLDRFFILNIAGLPFLDEEGKVYYPKNISEILPKELVKARKLARAVTPAELEVDGEEWSNLVAENAGMRLLEGGKKLYCKDESFFDDKLMSFCSHQFQKAHRIVNQTLNKMGVPTGDAYLGWRLRKMIESEILIGQGDYSKTLRDFEVKLPGGNAEQAETTESTSEENAA